MKSAAGCGASQLNKEGIENEQLLLDKHHLLGDHLALTDDPVEVNS